MYPIEKFQKDIGFAKKGFFVIAMAFLRKAIAIHPFCHYWHGYRFWKRRRDEGEK
jgi:hypothetical protein